MSSRSNGSQPDPAIERLGRLLEKDWDDDGDRVSVVINTAAPETKSSMWPPAMQKHKSRLVAIVGAIVAVAATVKVVIDFFIQ